MDIIDVTNPRRILAVSLADPDSTRHLTTVIKDLTGTLPEQASTSLAGSSHNLSIKTTYYKAEVPIWIDLISSPSEWSSSFLSSEAKEVLEVLGGIVLVFSLPIEFQSDEGNRARELIQHVGKVIKDGLGGWSWDGVCLCLGVGEVDDVDDWEDCCSDSALEFVQVRRQSVLGRNEFGEKMGIPRVLEALEANDWSQASLDDLGSDFGYFEAELGIGQDKDTEEKGPDLDPETLGFGFDREDFAGLKQAILEAGQEPEEELPNGESSTSTTKVADEENLGDEDIQQIETMIAKLQVVRETAAGLPEEQRKRLAAKAVAEVMKDMH